MSSPAASPSATPLPTPTPDSFDAYQSLLQQHVLAPTRAALCLPASDDLAFHRSLDRAFARDLDAGSARILGLANSLVSLASGVHADRGKPRKLREEEDVLDRSKELVGEVVDWLLEDADTHLDAFTGKSGQPPQIAINPSTSHRDKPRLDSALRDARHLPRPQLRFKTRLDNSSDSAWVPLLTHKPHGQVPLDWSAPPMDVDGEASDVARLPHPYYHEITHLTYPSGLFSSSAPIPARSFESTPFTWVSTPAELAVLLAKLREAKEIAVDLEHHSYRSFQGFVCLMQVSTREEDWVVDTLELREELQVLNEVFADPGIVKVLHGAESDVVWLQRDFGLYLVNLFDTYHATKVLEYPSHSLASLLSLYCDFQADKRYQLADWRIRPLPTEMLHYARADTHFLLYVYDHLRNALLDRASTSPSPTSPTSPSSTLPPSSGHAPRESLVREVLRRSEITALRTYEKERYDFEGGEGPGGWRSLARKWNRSVVGRVAEVFRWVHRWRDTVAREEDESTRYILPNHQLFTLAISQPTSASALLSALSPAIPPLVRARAEKLAQVVRDAMDAADAGKGGAIEVAPAVEETVRTAQAEEGMGGLVLDVWSARDGAGGGRLVARGSSLLGSGVGRQEGKEGKLVAGGSALFGSASAGKANSTTKTKPKTAAEEVLARVKASFTRSALLPSVSLPPAAPASLPSTLPEQIPYVPASARASSSTASTSNVPAGVDVSPDEIVVVGKAQKKRKRKEPAVEKAKGGDVKEEEEEVKEEVVVEMFDYSAQASVLDAPQRGGEAKRVKKEKPQKKNFYGDFGAAPMQKSMPASGNKSRTFK